MTEFAWWYEVSREGGSGSGDRRRPQSETPLTSKASHSALSRAALPHPPPPPFQQWAGGASGWHALASSSRRLAGLAAAQRHVKRAHQACRLQGRLQWAESREEARFAGALKGVRCIEHRSPEGQAAMQQSGRYIEGRQSMALTGDSKAEEGGGRVSVRAGGLRGADDLEQGCTGQWTGEKAEVSASTQSALRCGGQLSPAAVQLRCSPDPTTTKRKNPMTTGPNGDFSTFSAFTTLPRLLMF